jgi:hypothetical protein
MNKTGLTIDDVLYELNLLFYVKGISSKLHIDEVLHVDGKIDHLIIWGEFNNIERLVVDINLGVNKKLDIKSVAGNFQKSELDIVLHIMNCWMYSRE